MTTRKEKLDYLKGLVTGKRSLKELSNQKPLVLRIMADGPNKIYEKETGRELSTEECEEFYKDRTRHKHLKFHINLIDLDKDGKHID